MKKQLLLFILTLLPMVALADAVVIDGIYYNLNTVKGTAEVTFNPSKYTGDIVITDKFTYEEIEYSVTSIGYYAFIECSGLTSVTIPNSVTSIGYAAFYWCSSLTSVTIPNSVTSIGGYAFDGCYDLTSVTIGNSVTSIGDAAFSGCSKLTSVTIPNSVTYIGGGAFSSCFGLTSITIPNSVTSIGYDAFYDCTGLTTIISEIENPFEIGTIASNTVTLIVPKGTKAAYQSTAGWSSFTNIVESGEGGVVGGSFWIDGNKYVISEGNTVSLTTGNKNLSGDYEIPTQVTFNGIAYTLTSIGGSAFSDCGGLTSVTIPNSITYIGANAFSGTAWYNNQPNGLIYIGKVLYKYKGTMPEGTNINIEEGTVSISPFAFSDCSGLTSVIIPNSVTSIGESAFTGCSGLTSMSVESENSIYDSRNECNAIIETATNTLIAGCKNTIIPNSVTSIGNVAFAKCTGLTSVTIPNSVPSIGDAAFKGCSGLTSVAIPNSVTSIGRYAFLSCSGLTSVTIGNSVTSIGDASFYNCSSLTSVKVLATTPPTAQSSPFNKYTIPLYVPETSIETYRTTSPWSSFASISALSPEDLNGLCATPAIKYIGGKLKFECETEEVEFVSHFSTPAGADNNTSEVEIPTTYTVSVYAKKAGYLDSETVTADIDVRGLKGDVNEDGVVSITDAVSVVNIILNGGE